METLAAGNYREVPLPPHQAADLKNATLIVHQALTVSQCQLEESLLLATPWRLSVSWKLHQHQESNAKAKRFLKNVLR